MWEGRVTAGDEEVLYSQSPGNRRSWKKGTEFRPIGTHPTTRVCRLAKVLRHTGTNKKPLNCSADASGGLLQLLAVSLTV